MFFIRWQVPLSGGRFRLFDLGDESAEPATTSSAKVCASDEGKNDNDHNVIVRRVSSRFEIEPGDRVRLRPVGAPPRRPFSRPARPALPPHGPAALFWIRDGPATVETPEQAPA